MNQNLENEDLKFISQPYLTENFLSLLKIKNEIIENLKYINQKKDNDIKEIIKKKDDERKEEIKKKEDEFLKKLSISEGNYKRLEEDKNLLLDRLKKEKDNEIKKLKKEIKDKEEEIKKFKKEIEELEEKEDQVYKANKYKKLYRKAITVIKDIKENERSNETRGSFIDFPGCCCEGWDGCSTRCECTGTRMDWGWPYDLNEYNSDNSFDEDSIDILRDLRPEPEPY